MAQPNGPRPQITTGRNRQTLQNLATKQDVDEFGKRKFSLVRGGRPIDTKPAADRMKAARRPPTPGTPSNTDVVNPAVTALAQGVTTGNTSTVNSALPMLLMALQQKKQETGGYGGAGGTIPVGIRAQLIRGFRAAGRGDLAKMVRTRAFDTWLSAESGWNPNAVGGGLGPDARVGGLFQFMDFDERDWLDNAFNYNVEGSHGYGSFLMPVKRQAKMAGTMFDLTPADIRRYAREIRAGTYKGWG